MKFLTLPLTVISIIIFALIPATVSMAQDANGLVGSQWILIAYGAAGEENPLIADSTITLEFGEDDRVAGSGGCNTYSSTYTVENDTIAFSGVISTLKACAETGIMEQEQAYFGALQSTTSYEIVDDQLIITYGDGQQLVFARLSLLSDTQWQLVSYGEVGEETLVIADSGITLEFGEDDQAAGTGGCNTYGSSYTVENNSIAFSPITSTKMACMDETFMEQELAYFEALQAAASYKIADDQLIITYGDGGQLVFARINTLNDTYWQLVSYGAVGEETPVVVNTNITLGFTSDNQAGGSSGCNTYGGSYRIDGDSISFSEVFSTLMACTDNTIMAQETAYFEALQAATGYEIADDQLIITYGDEQQLVFVSTDPFDGLK